MEDKRIKELEAELRGLQEKRQTKQRVNQLKKQIRAEKFQQTKTGKVFNKIADIGDAGKKFLFTDPNKQTGSKKKKGRTTPSINDVMKNIDKAVGQFDF